MRSGSAGATCGHWFVVNTHPNREAYAAEHLERQAFSVYCPMISRRVRHARRAYDALRPLFPGYVFVERPQDGRWRSILGTFGVRSLVRAGEEPSLIVGEFIRELRAREVDGVVSKVLAPLAVGQSVAVDGGPFDGVIGQVIDLKDRERIVVLLQLMNGVARARLRAEDLRPVSSM